MINDLEAALVGMAIRDASVIPLTGLSASDFDVPLHQMAWEAIADLSASGTAPDSLSVAEAIEARHKVRCGPELGRMTREAPSPKSAPHYAEKVKDARARDRLSALAGCLVEDKPVAELVADAMKELTALSATGRKRSQWLREILPAVVDDLDGKALLPVVPSGFKDIDKFLGGLHGGDLIVVAARPAMGKTAFGLNLLRHACDAGRVVGMISGEQGREQIAQRMLALKGDISLARMRARSLDDSDWSRISTSMSAVKDYKLLIDDLPRPRLFDCISIARSWKHAHGLELLVVDYLQLIQAQGDGFRLQVGEVAQGLKALARELEIPVVVLAQVKREVESRPLGDGMGRLPYMGDIAESSIIEQAADQILTLYRPAVYPEAKKPEGEAWLNVAKNRHGKTGLIPMTWRGHSLRFENGMPEGWE
jgi:replicative DNA helicase